MGYDGSIITPFYDSLLVKVIASAQTYEIALHRMHRALSEFRIRGVKTNIPFLENVINHEKFRTGQATTTLIDTSPELFQFKSKRDRATKLLNFLGNVIVNGNPHAKGYKPEKPLVMARPVSFDQKLAPPPGTRDLLLKLGPTKFAEWTRKQKRLLVTDTTLRDAHQSLMATRVRTYDMLAVADALARRASGLFSLELWGGATFDTSMRFLHEDPWDRLRQLRARIPNICFQMLFRGSNAVGYSNYPENVVAGFVKHAAASGIDIFRIFDSLNYTPNLRVAMDAVQETHAICEAAVCYTGDILDPKRDKYSLKYYVKLAQELEKMGAHILAIKDMAGLCRPPAAKVLVKALREEVGIPVHFHTHDTAGTQAAAILQASEAGVDVVDLALASMSGSTSQPNLNSIVAALQHTPRDTGLDLGTLNEFGDYWERVREYYHPFDTAPKTGSAEVYLHEMPGGQYTNLKEQAASMGVSHRWPEIARTYAEVNQLFGDIVKVTPSSKVVGDMALFLFSRGVKPADVVNLEPGGQGFPDSVVDMLSGGLGWPENGWPEELQKVVLGHARAAQARQDFANGVVPGTVAVPADLDKLRADLSATLKRVSTEDDLYSYLMYPQVFNDFTKIQKEYSDVSVLPTHAFFYGLRRGEEINVAIEAGKSLIIKLVNVGEPDKDGRRTISYELNGMTREALIADKKIAPSAKSRPKADINDPRQIAAPIPGLIASISASVGQKVAKGEKLLMMEAMKMQTTVYASTEGVVEALNASVGDTVESKDLLIKIRAP